MDLEFGGLLRSYALGGGVYGNLGYGQKIWESSSEYMYGYLRPSVFGITSGVINSFGGQIDFYPISFLGVFAGSSYTYRGDTDILAAVDCNNFYCGGNIKRDYFGGRFLFGLGSFFLSSRYRVFKTSLEKGSDTAFIDELANTIASAGEDTRLETDISTGFNLSKDEKLGVSYRYNLMKNTESNTTYIFLFYQIKSGAFKYTTGAGGFESESGSRHPSFLFTVSYSAIPSIAL